MKKIFSLLLAVIMLLSVMATSGIVFAQSEPYLAVSNVEAECGEQITVNVSIVNSLGFGGMAYDIKYDNTVLRLISYSIDLGKAICTASDVDTYDNKVNFQYAGTSNINGDGVLVSLKFEIIGVASCDTEIVVEPEEGTTFYYDNRKEIDFSLKNATGIVTVKAKPVPVTGFTLDKTSATVETGEETLTLTPIFSPENATNKNLTWSSDNESVATVKDGVVTLIKKGVVTITATTEDGGYTASCVVTVNCSHKDGTDYPAESSTCIEQGHGAYTVCNECGEIVKGSDAKLPLAGHIYVEKADAQYLKTAATCNSKAVYYKSCSVCKATGTETFEFGEFDINNHVGNTYIKDQKEATCYEEGYTGDTYCSDCNTKISSGTVIEKNAHNPASVWSTDEDHHWKDCQTVGCGNIIDKAAHTGGEATCTKKAICSVCGVEYGAVNEDNHKNTEIRDFKAATCCEAGYTGDTWCTDCNTKIKSGTTIQATGNHVDADGKWESDGTNHWHTCDFGTKFDVSAHTGGEATCVNKAICSVCGTAYGEVNTNIHKHTETRDKKEPTCCEKGYTGDTWCIDCNTKIATGNDISVTGNHVDADGKWETDGTNHWHTCYFGTKFDVTAHTGGEATCTKKAICSVCGVEYGSVNEDNHKNTEVRDAVEATCTENGYSGDTYCKDCSIKIADGSVIPAGHKLKKVEAKDPTHDAAGNIEYYICSGCAKLFKSADAAEEIALKDTVIEKGEHDYGDTYKSDNDNHWKACGCGNVIDKAAHTFGDWSVVKEATDKDAGAKERVCSVCGYKATETIPASGSSTVPAPPSDGNTPPTGDESNIVLWMALVVISATSICTIAVYGRKKRAK